MIMNHSITKRSLITLLLTVSVVCSWAQDFTYTYVNAWIRLVAVDNLGKVYATQLDKGTPIFTKSVYDMKTQLPVYASASAMFMGHVKPNDGVRFVGWYLDDGDGTFDITKDEQISTSEEKSLLAVPIDNLGDEYETATQAKAKANFAAMAGPQFTLFALFTAGAYVTTGYHQDELGVVEMDKFPNAVGDQLTVEAFPEDGYEFAYWTDQYEPGGNIVSRENPYTFTVQGGEMLFAAFRDKSAPVIEFPAEGGYRAMYFDKDWVIDDESECTVYVFEPTDIKRDDAGRVYLDKDNEAAQYKIVQNYKNSATIMYGKGTVRMQYKNSYGFSRAEFICKWAYSDTQVYSTDGLPMYVYLFREDLGAFIEYGNTDSYYRDDAQERVTVPAGNAYIALEAEKLTDDEGHIPSIIAFTPEIYDKVLTGIQEVKPQQQTIDSTTIYTLSGLRVQATKQSGVYIINGKKTIVR